MQNNLFLKVFENTFDTWFNNQYSGEVNSPKYLDTYRAEAEKFFLFLVNEYQAAKDSAEFWEKRKNNVTNE